jgi:DNA-binding transcriptional ArsR family regulator
MPRAIRNPSNAIIEALSKRNKATWAELLEETKLSKGALSQYLKELINRKKISTETDGTKRPPKTLYSLVDPIEAARLDAPPGFFVDTNNEKNIDYVALAIYIGDLISKMKDREDAKKLLKGYIEFTSNILVADMCASIEASYISCAMSQALTNAKPSSSNARKALDSKSKDEAILELWKAQRKKFGTESLLQAIFWTAFKNSDVAFGEEHLFLSFGSELNRRIDRSFIEKILSAKEQMAKEASN